MVGDDSEGFAVDAVLDFGEGRVRGVGLCPRPIGGRNGLMRWMSDGLRARSVDVGGMICMGRSMRDCC